LFCFVFLWFRVLVDFFLFVCFCFAVVGLVVGLLTTQNFFVPQVVAAAVGDINGSF